MNYRMKPDALWPAYQTIERETSMTDQKRRMEDQLPEQRIDWEHGGEPSSEPIRVERQQALLNCAAALLKAERASCTAVVFPESEPQQFVMIGTADDILRLLPLPGATDGLLRATMREITTLLVENENVDHLFNDPDLVRLLSALTAMAVRRAAASPSAAPAAGQAGLAKLQRFEPATHAADVGEMIDCADGQYVLFGDVCALLAAPVAADTEQARDAVRYRWLRNQQSWGTVVYEAIGYRAGEDFDKAIDAAMGFTPGEISPALHSDDALRKTEGYRLGYMEGVARKQVDILEIANERRAVELTAERMADNLSEEEKAALDRLDKPEWRAASNLKLRALLAVEVANCIRMGAKIENLQDELRATEGYRRGYTDGAADAAGIADVQSDWRGIWDEGPLQGEAVLATNGTAVIAARWFATGWAKHDHFSEEVEYLPEGWVTHWKSLPPAPTAEQATDNDLLDVMDPPRAALKAEDWDAATRKPKVKPAAPLATPADAGAGDQQWDNEAEQLTAAMDLDGPEDAGAGLTPQRISELWMSLTHIDRYNRVEPFARAIEREVLASLSTPGAPVTAEPAQQWISVDEREPEDNQTVAILYWPYNNRENSQVAGAAEYVDGAFYTHEGDMHHWPSHWAPIPVLPAQPVATDEQGMERAADAKGERQ